MVYQDKGRSSTDDKARTGQAAIVITQEATVAVDSLLRSNRQITTLKAKPVENPLKTISSVENLFHSQPGVSLHNVFIMSWTTETPVSTFKAAMSSLNVPYILLFYFAY